VSAAALRTLAACALLCAAATTLAAPVAPHRADAAAGGAKADDERCIECHVRTDPATAQPGDGVHALLDGQPLAYLAKQMNDFRSGARQHAVMTLLSRNLDDGDLADILAWYAAKPWLAGREAEPDAAALRLVTQGDPARGIVACATCHGGPGQPPPVADAPRIAGQDAAYLAVQLRNWRSGDRRNSTGGLMTISARSLTDAEITALAATLAGAK